MIYPRHDILVSDKLFSAILDKKTFEHELFGRKLQITRLKKQIIIKFKISMTKKLPIYRSVYNGFVFLIIEI